MITDNELRELRERLTGVESISEVKGLPGWFCAKGGELIDELLDLRNRNTGYAIIVSANDMDDILDEE